MDIGRGITGIGFRIDFAMLINTGEPLIAEILFRFADIKPYPGPGNEANA
jgi:hypothetical protein